MEQLEEIEKRLGRVEKAYSDFGSKIDTMNRNLTAISDNVRMLYDEMAGTELNGRRGKIYVIGQLEKAIDNNSKEINDVKEAQEARYTEFEKRIEKALQTMKDEIHKYKYLMFGGVGVISFILGYAAKYISITLK